MLIIVWYVEFSGKQTVSQNARGTYQKSLRHGLKNVTNCLSALLFLPPGCFQKQNLAGKFMSFDDVCTAAPLRSLIAFRCASLCSAFRLILRVLQL